MKSYNDICSGTGQNYKNTGARSQCLEAVTVLLILSKDTFRFDTLEDFKDMTVWETAIKSKELIPLFELYELAPSNTDETFYESRNFKKRTQKAAKVTTAELYLSICSDNALRSYSNSEYNRVFEVTEEGDLIGVYDEDGVKIHGQKLKDFTVGIRQVATTEKPPTTQVSLTYSDYEELADNGILTTPSFDPVLDLNGIFDVSIEVLTSTTAAITFKVTQGCSPVNFAIADPSAWKILATDGSTEEAGVIAYNATTEVYTATPTTTYTAGVVYVSTDGVQTDPVTGDFYEGLQSATVTA